MHTRQDEKSFRTGDRDERSNKDACPLRGLRERGQKDVRVLARLVRTQPQSLIRDPLSCHRIMRRACRHGMGAHTGRNGRCKWAHTACQTGVPWTFHLATGKGTSRCWCGSGDSTPVGKCASPLPAELNHREHDQDSLESVRCSLHPERTVEVRSGRGKAAALQVPYNGGAAPPAAVMPTRDNVED